MATRIAFGWLATLVLIAVPLQAQGPRATLAVDAPVVRGGLQIGENTISTSIYNEQQLGRFNRRGGVEVTLVVSSPGGSDRTYTVRTRSLVLPGGQPPRKVPVRFERVEIPTEGAYVLTVRVEPDESPIEYNVSRLHGSRSATFEVNATVGGEVGSRETANAGHELMLRVRHANGQPGRALTVRLFTKDGTQLAEKRTTGTGQANFANLPPGEYQVRLFFFARALGEYNVAMPANDHVHAIEIS